MNQDKLSAIQAARAWLKEKPLYLDTETTGLGSKDQIVELALLDSDGTPLLNTLVQPTVEIDPKAKAVHGISMADVAGAPMFGEVLPALARLTQGRPVIIYNAAFDLRLMQQSAAPAQNGRPRFADIPPAKYPDVNEGQPPNPDDYLNGLPRLKAHCAMAAYAQFYGEWNQWSHGYRWQSQKNAAKQLGLELPDDLHRAAADAELCRRIVEAMAATATEEVTA